jgi:hypothetical protein
MAINITPGVGPQNTDIATAVAAAVPTNASITSAITTNAASAGVTLAAIGTQVVNNAPTAAAIATAVAAPSISSITSAITTNAASAGVTNASIATQVANNSPSANNWTLLASSTGGSPTLTFSSLSGYKTYKLVIGQIGISNNAAMYFRVNGDTGNNYAWGFSLLSSYQQTNASVQAAYTSYHKFADTFQSGNSGSGFVQIENANTTGGKLITNQGGYINSAGSVYWQVGNGIWNNSATVSSISFASSNGTGNLSGNYYLYGAN